MRERFINPATSAVYDWPINHQDEDAAEQTRNIERTAPTSGVGFVRQEGEPSPPLLRYTGTILEQAHRQAFQDWYELSKAQSIHFRDFAGNVFEVLITAFHPKRTRTVKNPRGGTINPYHYWTYTMEMEILQVISGDLP